MDTHESKIYNLFLISAAVLLLILFYYLFTIIRLQAFHRRNYIRRLGRQVMMLEEQRKQLSENLHDELAPMITAAKMHISSVRKDQHREPENLDEAIHLLNQITASMRLLSADLIPKILEHKGLKRALEDFVYNLWSSAAPTITLDIEELPVIEYNRSVLIYRVLQEIIHNTCKHAQASQLHIHLYMNDKKLVIATADDGIGFNYNVQLLHPSGSGIVAIASRINLLEGTLQVNSSASTGTKYYIVLPLDTIQNF